MTALTFTAGKISADQAHGSIIRPYVTAEAVGIGDVVALDSAGKVVLADGNGTWEEALAIGIVVSSASMYGETSIASGQTVGVCLFGPVYGFYGMTPGSYGYVSDTAGDLDDTPSSTNGFVVGRVHAADVFFVNCGVTEAS